jgi:hypothetical protein
MAKIEHHRPEGLFHNPAFLQVVAASGSRTIYSAGQVSIDERGTCVGAGDLAEQTVQAMRNVGLALAAAGATHSGIVKNHHLRPPTTSPNTEPSYAMLDPLFCRVRHRRLARWSVSPHWACRSGSSRSRLSRSLAELELCTIQLSSRGDAGDFSN